MIVGNDKTTATQNNARTQRPLDALIATAVGSEPPQKRGVEAGIVSSIHELGGIDIDY